MNKLKRKTKGCVYKINTPEKPYVGATTQKTTGRWSEHIRRLENNNHHNKRLQNIYNKYGITKIYFQVIENNVDIDRLDSREEYWIKKLNSIANHSAISRIRRDKLIKKVLNDIKNGKTYREISNIHDVSLGTISEWNRKYEL